MPCEIAGLHRNAAKGVRGGAVAWPVWPVPGGPGPVTGPVGGPPLGVGWRRPVPQVGARRFRAVKADGAANRRRPRLEKARLPSYGWKWTPPHAPCALRCHARRVAGQKRPHDFRSSPRRRRGARAGVGRPGGAERHGAMSTAPSRDRCARLHMTAGRTTRFYRNGRCVGTLCAKRRCRWHCAFIAHSGDKPPRLHRQNSRLHKILKCERQSPFEIPGNLCLP